MTLRSLFVFIHVVSAMGVFGTLAIEGALLLRLRRVADTADVLDALNGFQLLRVLAPLSLGPTVLSGMYLVRTVWGCMVFVGAFEATLHSFYTVLSATSWRTP